MILRPTPAAARVLVRGPSPYPWIEPTGHLRRIQLDAEANLRAQRRDLARDAAAAVLRASGDALAVQQAGTAWHTEERLDAMQSQVESQPVPTAGPWGESGLLTRRNLERSRLRLREQQRQRAVDARVDALRPPPPAPPKLGSLPATGLEPPPR